MAFKTCSLICLEKVKYTSRCFLKGPLAIGIYTIEVKFRVFRFVFFTRKDYLDRLLSHVRVKKTFSTGDPKSVQPASPLTVYHEFG